MQIAIIVAAAENGVIGRDGWMPWRQSTDLRRFKALTLGKPVIMGRKTFEAIGKPLPGRPTIVVTRNAQWRGEGVETALSLDEALARAREMTGAETIFVAGGGEIYRQALPVADRVHLTHVLAEVEGDTVFPALDERDWVAVAQEDVPAGERDTHATRYTVYERRGGRRAASSDHSRNDST